MQAYSEFIKYYEHGNIYYTEHRGFSFWCTLPCFVFSILQSFNLYIFSSLKRSEVIPSFDPEVDVNQPVFSQYKSDKCDDQVLFIF